MTESHLGRVRRYRARKAARPPAIVAVLVGCLLSACVASPRPVDTAPSPTSPASPSPADATSTPTPSAPRSSTASPSSPMPSTKALQRMVVDSAAREVPSRGGATLAPAGDGPLTGRVIVVDPGHNGAYRAAINTRQVPAGGGRTKPCNSSGTAAGSGYSEHRFNWDVARLLIGELRSRGAKVVLTRPDDKGTGPCVNERAAIGNRADADLVISIHADGNVSGKARGFHVILSTQMLGGAGVEADSKRFALILRRTIQTETGMPRSTYIGHGAALSPRTDIAGLNLSKIPGVMLEAGNMHHPKDAALLSSAEFRARLAKALADGATRALD